MNQKILELIARASNRSIEEASKMNWEFEETLIEMVIQECASFVDENLSETGFGQADGWINGDQLKEHFWVK